MTEYWKSQARKFCDDCKCWIADNKVSIAFHENGRKHQDNAQRRLRDIRHKSSIADQQAAKEAEILAQMEKKAMHSYRKKDLEGTHGDITGRIFNERRAEREAAKTQADVRQQEVAAAVGSAGGSIGPQIPGGSAGTATASTRVNALGLAQVEAPKSGTKWHKDGDEPKKWYEAKTEAKDGGHTYYWHVETNESRWDRPAEGFLSIAMQEEINKKHEVRETKKIYNMYQSQAIHGSHKDHADGVSPVEGPSARAAPYGAWTSVEPSQHKLPSFQAPTNTQKPDPSGQLAENRERFKFVTKATPILGSGRSSWQDDVAGGSQGSSVGFTFKKRKSDGLGGGGPSKKNIRRRNDDE